MSGRIRDRPHYRETQYGFEYGALSIERVWSHKGAVCVRAKSRTTGKYIEIQISPGGRKLYVGNGQMTPDQGLAGESK